MKKLALFVSHCLLLSGCLVGPNYCPPDSTIPDTWTTEPPENSCLSPCSPPPTAWWTLLNDCLLNQYIELAALNNNDLLAAETAIWQARALKQVAVSYLLPHVNADLSALRIHFSKNGLTQIFDGGNPNSTSFPSTFSIFNAFLDASWEIDVFGKRRRGIEIAVANIGSAIEQKNALLLSIFAEVALNYIELRSAQKRVILVEENIAFLEKNSAILQKRVEVGYSNRLDLERVEAELAADRANLPNLYTQIYQNIYALSVLTGNLPETLVEELLPMQPIPSLPPQIAIGMRSDLLRRRPDIRKAERDLAAATANIGVAVASFFPTFNLLGIIGFNSLKISQLFQAHSLTWALYGGARAPIYQGGKLTADLHNAQAQAAASLFTYQQVVLNAVNEAESALVAFKQEIETAGQLSTAVDKYEDLVYLTNERFTKGLVSVTDLLDIQRQWNAAEQNFLTSETAVLVDLVILYKALGGGWEPQDCLNEGI